VLSKSLSKKRETAFEILKVVGVAILLLLGVGLFLVFVLFIGLLALTWDIGKTLEITGFLINPFLIFESFGWGGIVVWLVIWLIVAAIGFRWVGKS